MSSLSYHTSILCKYLLIIALVATLFMLVFFNLTYISSQYVDSNKFAIKCEEGPKETTTNLSHLMFVLVGSSRAWKHRRTYIESWWRPNVTRGNIFLDVEPSEEFRPWSPTFPPFKVNEDLRKLRIYPKLANRVHIRIYRSILETYRLKQDDGVRWYVMGDDDSLFFVDNIVDVLSKYDHTEKHYIGMFSESTKSNFRMAFEMAYGGGGYALSYPLVEALVRKLDECVEKYHFIWAGDQLQSFCLADLGADLIPEKGFHQMDLRGDLSGLLSSHPTAPLLSLHHFEAVAPLFPGMDHQGSVLHIMKAANVDQSRMVQQSICYVRASNWTFSVSWGYSVHIYENIFPRSYLKLPIETFRPWLRGWFPFYMFNTRRVSRNPCEAPHWFFFDSIEQENGGVVTSYTRKFIRNLTSCSFSGNISADPLASIRVFSSKTPKEGRKVECCDVEYEGADVANMRLRDCRRGEMIR
ncbi:hypothetical protein Rs2_33043 [Raphanus sativus]|uniref:Uncharacterized protein LOC108815180 n=1 Tax=Raphanus sativus TaxID=3726 RepID=A0A6J0K6Y3_RAPSA|nr:uncharacterized protein LOC108815180 [Raphanus sativus]KAJ4882950.1 hypothetical protein Rs2_33043 [Raphanus sativus]